MSRQRTRINRRSNLRQDRSTSTKPVFPRGDVPSNVAQTQRGRVEEVVEGRRSIAVEDASPPGHRARGRGSLQPTDGAVAAIQDGFMALTVQLGELVSTLRIAHGIDAADEELAQLREMNSRLTTELEGVQRHLRALVAQQAITSPPSPDAKPEVVAEDTAVEAPVVEVEKEPEVEA